jgi:hypothetical protein
MPHAFVAKNFVDHLFIQFKIEKGFIKKRNFFVQINVQEEIIPCEILIKHIPPNIKSLTRKS